MGSRRGHGEGSIYQRESDGKWCAVVDLGYVNGKRKRKVIYGDTRREVAEKLKVLLRDQQQGLPVAVERQTVAQFLSRWLADLEGSNLAPKTLVSYEGTMRLHIVPTLGRYQLEKLGPQHVQALLTAKRQSGLSPRSVKYILVVLKLALGQALKWGLVPRNVAALVDPPKVTKHKVVPFTPDEARTFLKAVQGERLEALYAVSLALGLRQGEALGLTWDHIDVDNDVVRVRQQLQRVKGKQTLRELKTETSRRDLVLPVTIAPVLRAHRLRQLEERMASADWQEWNLVFCSTRGTPLEPSNVRKRYKWFLAAAGLPVRRYHDLRHSCASFLLALGVPTKAVQEILGHSQSATTLDIYAHLLPEAHRDAAAKLDGLFAAGD